jgi:hypothetical protein
MTRGSSEQEEWMPISDQAKYYMSTYIEAAEAYTQKEILAANLYQPAGTAWASWNVVGGLGGMLESRARRKRAAQKAGGLPEMVLVAVSADEIHILEVRFRMGKPMEIPRTVKTLDRSAFAFDESRAEGVYGKIALKSRTSDEYYAFESTGKIGKSAREPFEAMRQLLGADPSA